MQSCLNASFIVQMSNKFWISSRFWTNRCCHFLYPLVLPAAPTSSFFYLLIIALYIYIHTFTILFISLSLMIQQKARPFAPNRMICILFYFQSLIFLWKGVGELLLEFTNPLWHLTQQIWTSQVEKCNSILWHSRKVPRAALLFVI